jgi:hypothetical protein
MSNRPDSDAAAGRVDDPGEHSIGNYSEAIPNVWDDSREPQFFHILWNVFPARFLFGAGVLLGSYDSPEAGF